MIVVTGLFKKKKFFFKDSFFEIIYDHMTFIYYKRYIIYYKFLAAFSTKTFEIDISQKNVILNFV